MPTFDIVRASTGEIVETNIESASAAAALARSWTAQLGVKFEPRPSKKKINPNTPPAWHERERLRMRRTYKALPWRSDGIWRIAIADSDMSRYRTEPTYSKLWGSCQFHFAHPENNGETETGLLAYFPDDRHGEADRKTPIKPGAYLTRFLGKFMDGGSVKLWANRFIGQYGPVEIRFAKDADEIQHVYENGPPSCMSGKVANYFDRKVHPVRAYAAGDLAIAYATNGETISQRALCWPEKKIYGRVYGEGGRLERELEKLGYKKSDHFGGAKIAKIISSRDSSYAVMPYLDHVCALTDQGKHFVLDRNGNISGGSTHGITTIGRTVECDCCSEHVDARRIRPIQGQNYCNNCFENETCVCAHCDTRILSENAYTVFHTWRGQRRNAQWCRRCAEQDAGLCDATGGVWRRTDLITIHTSISSTQQWSRPYFDANGCNCKECNQNVPRRMAAQSGEKWTCTACTAASPKLPL